MYDLKLFKENLENILIKKYKKELKDNKIMTEIICTNALCKFCLYNHCENPKVKSEIANILTILKIEIQSCKGYVKEEDLIDPHS